MVKEELLKIATQVAYLSFLGDASENLKADGRKAPFTVRELIMSWINFDVAMLLAKQAGISKEEITLQVLVEYSDLRGADKAIIKTFTDEVLDWKIVSIHDRNEENGLYACTIEDSEKTAIVAFRGSEKMYECESFIRDWMRADFALLNSRRTRQQEAAAQYVDKLWEKGILNKYESINITGHSLGGNLAAHTTIAMAQEGRNKGLWEKIEGCTNFDGPGFSKVYLEEHDENIEKASSKITHLKWSAVGSLLYDVPGERVEFLAINEELHKDNLLDWIKYKTITRHSTKSLLFNKDGRAQRGKQDPVSKGLSLISKAVDRIMPEALTIELFAAADWIFDQILKLKQSRDGISIKFNEISWSEWFAQKGSILGKCGKVIDAIIEQCKESVANLGEAITGIFGENYTNHNSGLKLALADGQNCDIDTVRD